SFANAAQVLTPPQAGLPYLRTDRAGAMRLDPGGLTAGDDGRIAALEPTSTADLHVDATGCALLLGLVDCHTHLPFAGWRAQEYEQKVTGVPYEEISKAGGGIASSARGLRETPDDAVLQQATDLAAEMLAHGTTTFECKSGYGLSRAGELRALKLATELDTGVVQQTTRTALLAHAVPDGYTADSWMDEVEAMFPEATRYADTVDIFVESIAFGLEHLDRMGELAANAGVRLRAHVEQFSTMRSVPVAVEHNARSLDHLSAIHPDDVGPLGRSETAAVLLPGAEFMGAEATAPARDLIDAGAIVVLATDANPGTSPVFSLPLIVGLAVRRYGLSTREALLAVTLNAAYVLNLSHDLGSIEPGKRADLVLLDSLSEHVPYRLGHNPVAAAFVAGRPAYLRPDARWRIATDR
ncbi:MAG: imidazolonepropionase, partial [Solirubrobacterales bacterium]|nr:imidazolonepropionase [Solirubrobacterales bacterium]